MNQYGEEYQVVKVNLWADEESVQTWNFYQTPYTVDGEAIYWIQSVPRSDPVLGCIDKSWIAWDDAKCQIAFDTSPSDYYRIPQVSNLERTMWKIKRNFIDPLNCFYLTIVPYVAPGADPSFCVDNEYRIDFIDNIKYEAMGIAANGDYVEIALYPKDLFLNENEYYCQQRIFTLIS